MLVELGFDVDSVNQNGSTPLHRACYRKNIELVILLTNHGANYSLRDKVLLPDQTCSTCPTVWEETC
jgi:ankyrin repeat protein